MFRIQSVNTYKTRCCDTPLRIKVEAQFEHPTIEGRNYVFIQNIPGLDEPPERTLPLPDREAPPVVYYHQLSSLIANMLLVKTERLPDRCTGPTCVQYFSIFTL